MLVAPQPVARPTAAIDFNLHVVCAVGAVGPAVLLSMMAALPAQAAGSGAELARPLTAESVKSAVNSVPSILEPSTVDQAVNSVVDVVKVTIKTHVLRFFCRPDA